ncbi:ATP-grasp domain-containing protein [Dehalococcoidia bacterium]|nr:ATP-grasp domain-containing protein [Dehalococcoidia bacterium]
MVKEKIKIIRSAVGSMPSWGLIDELQKRGVKIIGMDSNPLSFGLYILKKSYVIPRGDDPNFITEILKIIDIEQPNAILSGPEEELLILSKNKRKIEERGTLLLCPDYEYVEICVDKKKTNEVFERIGIPTPEIFTDIDSVEFPCIIKPRFGRGSSDVYIAKNKDDLYFYLKKVNEPIIQEFIQGEEYTVDILADKGGNALSVIPRLRLGVESGISVKGKTVYDKEIIDYCKKITKELKLFGPSCIQCIRNDEGVRFIEVNTRFGGGSILSIKADPTIIPNLIKMIKGEKPEPSGGFKEDLVMLRYHSEVFILEEEIKKSGEFS